MIRRRPTLSSGITPSAPGSSRRMLSSPSKFAAFHFLFLLLLAAVTVVGQLTVVRGHESLLDYGSIATGSGRIFRPARSGSSETAEMVAAEGEEEIPAEAENDSELPVAAKRSMTLGRLAFRPGKRRFLPNYAFAHDPQNRQYELLFMEDQPNAAESGGAGSHFVGQPKLVSHVRFRLVPGKMNAEEEDLLSNRKIQESSMGKRSSVASGRFGFRPAKRSMAVGRTGFRPGKRSIATGRIGFRPGKRSLMPAFDYYTNPSSVDDSDMYLIR